MKKKKDKKGKKIKKNRKARKEKHLKILAVGDLHGDTIQAEKLARKAKKEKVDLIVLLGDLSGIVGPEKIIEPFKKAKQKIVFIPGNWDSSIEAAMLRDIHKVKNLDGYYTVYKDVGIVGVGTSDFKLSLSEKKVLDKLNKNVKKMKSRKKILISHLHPAGTKSEFSGIPGEPVLKKAIKYFKPDLFLHAHIHEAEGIEEKIGKTKVINIGRKGKIIVI
jgi:Icc-related predicted phosphoesterase